MDGSDVDGGVGGRARECQIVLEVEAAMEHYCLLPCTEAEHSALMKRDKKTTTTIG